MNAIAVEAIIVQLMPQVSHGQRRGDIGLRRVLAVLHKEEFAERFRRQWMLYRLPALYPNELTVPHARAVLEVNVAGEVAIADIGVLADPYRLYL